MLAWLSPFDETNARRRERADVRTRVLMALAPNAAQFEVLSCLPTASVLPIGRTGDIGTSPFWGSSRTTAACP